MTATYDAYIEATAPSGDSTGKFLVGFNWPDPEMGDMPVAFKIFFNSDVSVPQFTAKLGAVTITVPNRKKLSGLFRFTGNVGGGRIFLKIESTIGDVIVEGTIEGGPDQEQTFAGAGTFIRR
jgi:hypothetical protein